MLGGACDGVQAGVICCLVGLMSLGFGGAQRVYAGQGVRGEEGIRLSVRPGSRRNR